VRAKLVTLGILSPWGISSRLMIAFVAVAVLAAAANLIVEQGASIIAGPTVKPVPLAPAAPKPGPSPPPITEAAAPEPLSTDDLTKALERFDQAVYAAVAADSVDVLAQYRQTEKNLDRATASFLLRAKQFPEHSFRALPKAIRQHQRDADRWIELSQSRRKLLRDYSETLEHMNTQVNESLDGAFKILGRVVARQSLVQLNAKLDAVRDIFSTSVRTGSTSVETFNEIHTAEAAVGDTLQKNAKGLRRSEGEEWFAGMEKDFTALSELRAALENSHREFEATGNSFVNQTGKLLASLPKLIEVKVVAAQPAAQLPLAPQIDTGGPAAVQPQPAIESSPGVVTLSEPETSNRATVAWISIAVLTVLLLISIATVRSVANPVRRMIAASRRIAAGEHSARVGRGGVKELDALAVAFNDMAEQLAAAHANTLDTHHQLEQKVAERTRQLQELAELDPLTGLPNRRHLFTLLDASIRRATRDGHRLGVLFLDIDNFKNINDSVGHRFGDSVLRGIAQRLETAARPLGFAARLGGDEFTIVCDKATSLDDIRAAGEQIIRAFQSPITVEGRELIVGVSVGASAFPDHEQTAEALLIAADAALFNAKALGRSRLSVFTPELVAGAAAKFRIEQDLRRAIERNEFELFFQPEVGIEELQTNLVEALVRWRMPDGRCVPPGEFLSVAEESGLIIEISDWVLRTAIQAAAHWHHGAWPQARVAINVSPRQLLDYGFVDRVQQLLTEFNLPSRCIEIELTESVLQTGPSIIEQLHRLRALGVAIALDDFGTGYSSLSSLEQLPLTRVKLDRSLIESIDSNARSRSIARAIIELCNGLNLHVTAEGVERAEQFECFLGCKNLTLQGYLLSRPVPAEQLFTAMADAAQRAQELVLLSKPRVGSQSMTAATLQPGHGRLASA
jgi:diguanylate cyclase (GGDEF)-like protein